MTLYVDYINIYIYKKVINSFSTCFLLNSLLLPHNGRQHPQDKVHGNQHGATTHHKHRILHARHPLHEPIRPHATVVPRTYAHPTQIQHDKGCELKRC